MEYALTALAGFVGTIPPEVRAAVRVFAYRHYHLLRLAGTVPGFRDLLHTNPTLAFLLGGLDEYRPRPFRHALTAEQRCWAARHAPTGDARVARLVAVRQREALALLGFPPQGAVTVTRKVVPAALTVARCRTLSTLLAHDAARVRFAHLPRVNAGALGVFVEGVAANVTGSLLHTIAATTTEDHDATTAVLVRDTLALARQCGVDPAGLRFATTAQLHRVHDELLATCQRAARERAAATSARPTPTASKALPAPPFPGTDTIIPLTTPAALRAEGRVMRHCVASYVHLLRRRHGRRWAVYRVLAPERATLSLVYETGGWALEQLRGVQNKSVRHETAAVVDAWLESEQHRTKTCQRERTDLA